MAALPPPNPCGCARHEWLFQSRFAQGRVAQLDLAPTLAAFASRSVISTPPRFAKDYSAHARLAALGTASKLVGFVFEQDVERGERSGGRCVNRNSWIVNRCSRCL